MVSPVAPMRFYVEPSPAGGYFVKLAGSDAPVSRHDTEEEALARRDAYQLGASAEPSTGENVRLRDGAHVLVRAVRPDDKPLFVAGFERLSEESRYLRFMGYKKLLSVRDLEFFTELDHADHEAIGAIDPFTGEGLAVARYMRLAHDRSSAEAAVAVIDAWQGRGLGSVLLERLVERAREHGIERFEATLFTDNRAMLTLFQRIGEVEVLSHEGQAMEIDVALSTGDDGALHEALRVAARGEVGGSGLDPA
jgi:GNAT superfamily N-acetyltransferase